ncbi:hypothetical protein [Streptomyces sp. NPDC051173]
MSPAWYGWLILGLVTTVVALTVNWPARPAASEQDECPDTLPSPRRPE